MVNYKMKNDEYKDLREALSKGKVIQLNGTAINGGYGETWNDCKQEDLFIFGRSAYRIKPEKQMITTKFKIGDIVVNKQFCEYTPFVLANKHFKGVTRRNQEWFDSLEHSRIKLTLESLIEEIENRKQYATYKQKEVPNSTYWTGYADALGELLEFIDDNS